MIKCSRCGLEKDEEPISLYLVVSEVKIGGEYICEECKNDLLSEFSEPNHISVKGAGKEYSFKSDTIKVNTYN